MIPGRFFDLVFKLDIPGARPSIEVADEGDMTQIIGLLKLCGTYFLGEEEWLSKSTIVVARHNGKVVGTRCFRRISDDYFHAYGLCVHPEFRGKGISVDLFEFSDNIMYEDGARGYLGEALNEKLAQYYVRKRGVKICRLSLRGWRNNLVPIKREFRQEGLMDSFLKRVHDSVVWLMKRRCLRWLSELFESASRRIKPY